MAGWKETFQSFWDKRNRHYLNLQAGGLEDTDISTVRELARWERVREDLRDRKVKLKRSTSKIEVLNVAEENPNVNIWYRVGVSWDLEQEGCQFRQSWMESRICVLKNKSGWWVTEDKQVEEEGQGGMNLSPPLDEEPLLAGAQSGSMHQRAEQGERYTDEMYEMSRGYNRHRAVEYAHRWWNSYNPQFKHFEVDCTNYVSQCLWAGGAPLTYSQDRTKGWWYRFETPPNWSFSWAVAHSLRWYLAGSTSGLRAREVQSARELEPGDVICYDFDGDGRWQHTTVVVAKDAHNEPLVNAHTTNSQNRYWAYRDSSAWTPNIQYKFFHIIV
ncbi:hypothetical protein CathTA2_1675 [Caldalkalibacillus thermarum TA2.A1]|uniref:Putative amidase domain-containing protein n=1 Tax=Caldalkalibacillus thermarum (strain TA2.A1) TaxID=986075 RepID=F5L770_CALTT|nr:amidase domain-containing protein [Caldalkalibacillus thermarum]EGL82791.1 hypothetical protein CathTA2_1675 [Caldalkalibacillus thermarum TA2.A1]